MKSRLLVATRRKFLAGAAFGLLASRPTYVCAQSMLLRGVGSGSDGASLPHTVTQFTTLSQTDKTAVTSVSASGQAATCTSNGLAQVRSVDACNTTSGVVYFEATMSIYGFPNTQSMRIGIATANHSLSTNLGSDADSAGFLVGNGETDFKVNNVQTNNISTGVVAQGDVIGIKIDFPNKLMYFSNITQGGGFNPGLSGAGVSFSALNPGPYFICVMLQSGGDVQRINTGLLIYAGALPNGAKNWLASTTSTYSGGQQSQINRVKGLIAGTSFPSVMASPPTINNLPTGQASNIPSARFVSIADGTQVKGYGSSNYAIDFTAALSDSVTRNYYTGSNQFYAGTSAAICASFNHTGSQIDFVFGGTSAWQLFVNGQLISASEQSETVAGSTVYVQQVIFSGSATRRITIVSQNDIAGFYVASGDIVTPADPFTGTLSIGFQGDSYLQNSGSTIYYGIANETAFSLGCQNIWIDTVGGTGYIAENAGVHGGVNTNFIERLGIMTPSTPVPDMFVSMGGINDTSSLTAANITSHISKVRGMFPNVVLVYLGPWCPIGTKATAEGDKWPSIRDVIKQALNTDTGPWIFIDNLLGRWYNSSGQNGNAIIPALQGPAGFTGGQWQTGVGFVGSTTGIGNGDTWVDTDDTHPTVAGVDGLRQLVAGAIQSAVAAL